MDKKELAKMIDQTLLTQTATESRIREFCMTAGRYGFATVCVNPVHVRSASSVLDGSGTRVCTVIDFPLGAGGLDSKKAQAKAAVEDGAAELDFVNDLSLVKAHEWKALEKELKSLTDYVNALSAGGRDKIITKLILETCLLDDEEIAESSLCAAAAGFDFVKTSTGFAILRDSDGRLLNNGATEHAVGLMRKTVGPGTGVKASGGIRSTADALRMIECGATRIGSSAGVAIVDGL